MIPIKITPGEAFDRLTILQLKVDRIADEKKRAAALEQLADLTCDMRPELRFKFASSLHAELARINGELWGVEDRLRALEVLGEFGNEFVQLARSVYRLNDRRAEIKRQIDSVFGVQGEVKSYG